MKLSYKYLLLSIVALSSFSCQKELMDQEVNDDVPVIESYISEGDTVITVKISSLLPFTEDGDVTQNPIENLAVVVNHNGTIYTLTETSSGIYQQQGIVISAGDHFEMNIDYNGTIVSASTTIPEAPTNFQLSASTMYLERVLEGEMGVAFFDPLEIYWDNPTGGYYFLTLEYLESSQDLINGNFASVELPNSTTTSIINGNGFNLGFKELYFFGSYRIVLHHVNEEYAELFENISQSTQNLTNPMTNVNNGWGIFTGTTSKTMYLEIEEL